LSILGAGVRSRILAAIVQGGDWDDGNILRGGVALDRAPLIAVHARHRGVEQDQVRRMLRHHGERFLAAGRSPREPPRRQHHWHLSVVDFIVTIRTRAGRHEQGWFTVVAGA
jgi:hypothetical protein